MNQDETRSEHILHLPLISVKSGKICRLVGVSEGEWVFRKKHGSSGSWGAGHHRRGHHAADKHGTSLDGRPMMLQGNITRRLLDLGLTRGCTFKVVQGSRFGPILIEVRGTRIALGHGLARRLMVEEVSP